MNVPVMPHADKIDITVENVGGIDNTPLNPYSEVNALAGEVRGM